MIEHSELQDVFLENVVDAMRASRRRAKTQLQFLPSEAREQVEQLLWHEIKGLVHGVLCEFDGATSLADVGLLSIVDEEGTAFVRHLHQLLFDKLTDEEA